MLNQVQEQLLAPAEIGERELSLALGRLTGGAVDWGDLYFERSCSESWSLEDGIVRNGAWDLNQGVGVRALAGERSGFAYADTIAVPALLEAADSARAIARAGQSGQMNVPAPVASKPLYAGIDPTSSHPSAVKVDLLRTVDAYVRSLDKRIVQVSVGLSTSQDIVLIAASDGTLAADVRPLIRLDISVVLEENGRRERGHAGGGGRYGLERLLARDTWQAHADEAVRQAQVNLTAESAPAGTMTVVLGSGWAGVLLHEAIGHGLEGDFNRKGVSAFSGRMGEQVATPACTVVDDGTLPERRGSLTVDDEGTPSGYNVLIENGRLTGYMQDKHNARLMGMKPTGNGRRESFAHQPMPRMTNTYMLPGEHDPDEIIASVDDGIYAANFEGGQVDITSGKFVFCASEAYRIKNGKLGAALKGATLIGNGPDVLTRVSMVGNDLELDHGVGVCGKEGQGVPVGVGQPTMRVDGLTVGGTAE